jgi:hypothetical protein
MYFHLRIMKSLLNEFSELDRTMVNTVRLYLGIMVDQKLYPVELYTLDRFQAIWLVVDFGVEGRSEYVKLLMVVILNQQNSDGKMLLQLGP